MAVKYMRDEDAQELERVIELHGATWADVLSALVWQHGAAAAKRVGETLRESSARLRGGEATTEDGA